MRLFPDLNGTSEHRTAHSRIPRVKRHGLSIHTLNIQGSGIACLYVKLMYIFAIIFLDKFDQTSHASENYINHLIMSESKLSHDTSYKGTLRCTLYISENKLGVDGITSVRTQNFAIWAATWQNPTKLLCAHRRLGSAGASTQSDPSLRYDSVGS